MIIGFTGTRSGMTNQQRLVVRKLLADCKGEGDTIGLHGDCLGADADFDSLCKEAGFERRIRPCTYPNMRAYCDADLVAPPKAPMQRNRDIVADADVMIACPPNFDRIRSGSGTWATIGFSERAGKPLYIVFPDGSLETK